MSEETVSRRRQVKYRQTTDTLNLDEYVSQLALPTQQTRREPVMDLTAAFAFLDSDFDDDEAPIPLPFPPFVVPDFFEEDDGESDNMV